MAKAASPTIEWVLVSSDGPAVVFHAACIIKDVLYIHGGLITEKNKTPVNDFNSLNLRTNTWKQINSAKSPCLSHHTAVAFNDRYILLIGGWNGISRLAGIHCFDISTKQWTEMNPSGYPQEAGLSSHASILCENNDILVVGREGNLHSQRKHSSAYILSGDPGKGNLKYSLLTYAVDSRSGHICIGNGRFIYLVGGRKDNLIEIVAGVKSKHQLSSTKAEKLKALCETLKPMSKYPAGRRHHVGVGGHGVIFIHGGEVLNSCSNTVSGDMFVLVTEKKWTFYKVGTSNVSIKGHSCCCYNDKIIIHGGASKRRPCVKKDTFELVIA